MGAFRIRPYHSGDEHSINEGFNTVFGHDRTLAEWRWKFQPDHGGCAIMVAVDEDDTVLAQYAALVLDLRLDQTTLKIGQIVDVFSRPQSGLIQYRAFLKTANAFFDHFAGPNSLPLLYGFPGERAMKLGRLRLNYHHFEPVSVWQRTLRWRLARSFRYSIRFGFHESDLDQLWQRASPRYTAIVRDAAWMHRRFLSHPLSDYTFVNVWSNHMQAQAVLRLQGDTAQWVDLLWDGHDPRALAALETETCRWLRKQGVRRCSMWLHGDEEAETIFTNQGWTRTAAPAPLYLVIRSFDPALPVPSVFDRFYYTMADSDLV